MINKLSAIVLAAGYGSRMNSSIPKVLHTINNLTLLDYVLKAIAAININDVCLVLPPDLTGFEKYSNKSYSIVSQLNRKGTADAVAATAECFGVEKKPHYYAAQFVEGAKINSEYTLICLGDCPAITSSDLEKMFQNMLTKKCNIALLAMEMKDPYGYGRVMIQNDLFVEIIEQKDASDEVKKVTTCNSGIAIFKTSLLFKLLNKVKDNNSANEYYLTDCFALAANFKEDVYVYTTKNGLNYQGINTKEQLQEVAKLLI